MHTGGKAAPSTNGTSQARWLSVEKWNKNLPSQISTSRGISTRHTASDKEEIGKLLELTSTGKDFLNRTR